MEQQLIRSDRLASLGTLVAGIAHEINNPLGIIAGYAEALLDRADDPAPAGRRASSRTFPEYLRTIHHEIFRCKSILQSLLEFARPSGGTFREIDVNELIKEVLLLLQHRTARLQHRIDLRLTRELPKISADAGQPAAGADEPAAQRDLLHAGGREHHDHDRGGRGPARPGLARAAAGSG